MSKEPKARDFNLDEIMKNIDIKHEEEDAPLGNISLEQSPNDKSSRAVEFLNRYWNLSQYDMVSKRKNFSGIMTLYKKLLAFFLKPFINVIVFKQAEFNAQLAQLNTLFNERISNLEKISKKIESERGSLKQTVSEESKKLDQKFQQMTQKIISIEKDLKDYLHKELDEIQEVQKSLLPRAQEDMDKKLEDFNLKTQGEIQNRLEKLTKEIGTFLNSKLSELSGELDTFKTEMNQKVDKNLSNMTQMLLDSLGDEETDSLLEEDFSNSDFEEWENEKQNLP